MSIISDGETDLTFVGVNVDDFQNLDKSTRKTAGGGTRSIVAGRKFVAIEKYRMTGAEYKELIELLDNGSTQYYYTPSIIPDHMNDEDFPLLCNISAPKKDSQAGGGVKKYFITLEFEGVDYL